MSGTAGVKDPRSWTYVGGGVGAFFAVIGHVGLFVLLGLLQFVTGLP